MERSRAWAETKAKEKVEFASIAAEDREKADSEARVRRKSNDVQRASEEAATKIRAKAEAKIGKIDRAEAE